MDVTDDPESPDAAPLDTVPAPPSGAAGTPSAGGGFDLRPRATAEPGSVATDTSRSPRRYFAIAALVAILIGLGVVLFIGLNDAAQFFYNVDEAVELRDELQGERFRMQGNVVEDSVSETTDGVDFVITYGGVEVPVSHTGTPPELFGPDIPVVIEGTFDGGRFVSDEILIRHDNEYDEEHPDRIDDAERDAQASGNDG